MGKLISLHLHRALHDRVVIWFTIVIALLALLDAGIMSWISIVSGSAGVFSISPTFIVLNSYQISSFPGILFAIMLILFVRKDINYGTLRNQVVSGYSKKDIYFSYVFSTLIIGAVGLFVFQLLGLGFASILIPSTYSNVNWINFGAKYAMGILIFVVMISLIVAVTLNLKNSLAGPLVILVILPIVATFTITIIYTICSALSIDVNAVINVFEYIYYYQALSVSGGDIVFMVNLGASSTNPFNYFVAKTVCTNVALIALVNIFGAYSFIKSDLK